MTVEEFEQRVLSHPFLAIYVLNALDCRGLGLLCDKATQEFVKDVHAVFEGVAENDVDSHAEELMSDAVNGWRKRCKHLDARAAEDVRDRSEIGTVTTFASFGKAYASAFNAAEAYIDDADLAKVDALIRRQRGKIIDGTPLSDEQVDRWVAGIAQASSNGVPLVKGREGIVWVAPGADSATPMTATDYRDRLGLVHLPLYGQTHAEETTLMRISFDAAEFAAKCEVKRPNMFDRPGPRFRALTAAECNSACETRTLGGRTVHMGTASYDDGQSEWIFHAQEDARFDKWSLKGLGRLSGLHPDAHTHTRFMQHLLRRQPEDASAGAFRQSPPWDLSGQLRSCLDPTT